MLDAIPTLRRHGRGRPRRRPGAAYGDRAYGTRANHAGLRRRHVRDFFADPGTVHGSGLGAVRQAVERALCWVGQARRLKVRYEKLVAPHRALHYLQMARMCCRILQRDF